MLSIPGKKHTGGARARHHGPQRAGPLSLQDLVSNRRIQVYRSGCEIIVQVIGKRNRVPGCQRVKERFWELVGQGLATPPAKLIEAGIHTGCGEVVVQGQEHPVKQS